jgi:hypothetical protein
MTGFAKLNNEKYPKKISSDDQSYGFLPAFKLQTGNTRGVQTVGYGNTKIDGNNNIITIAGSRTGTYPSVIIGYYMDDRFGIITSSADGLYRQTLNGQHPVDGRPGFWSVGYGIDVIDELST